MYVRGVIQRLDHRQIPCNIKNRMVVVLLDWECAGIASRSFSFRLLDRMVDRLQRKSLLHLFTYTNRLGGSCGISTL